MKRIIPYGLIAVIIAAASLVFAQAPSQVTLRAPAGDRPLNVVQKAGQTYFSVDDVVAAFPGGSASPDGNGFRVTIGTSTAAVAPDSRFGVIRDDLIEMPVPPISIEGHAFVPWQFFQGFLGRAQDMEVTWDPATRILLLRPQQHNAIGAQLSMTNVQGTSKVVVTLSAPAEYGIVKDESTYTIRFKAPIKAPFGEQTFEDPNVTRATFTGSDLRLQLAAADIVGDAYKLDNPFRIVLDFRKGAPSGPTTIPLAVGSRGADNPGIHTIVIDPGHGGKDVGATGPAGMMEKDMTLAVCRKLADSLQNRLHARVILTRADDSVVSLDQRTAIANQYHADLFLSVHMNAAVVKGAHGSETYFLSLDASDEIAKRAAETENASAKASGGSGGSDLKMILWDLAQQEYINESNHLAQDIQEEMNHATSVLSRGVKQAPFKVLVGATMPAALVEVAFITNPEEEAKLKSDEFQKRVVEALTTAVERYKSEYELRIGMTPAAPVGVSGTTGSTGSTGTTGAIPRPAAAPPAALPPAPALTKKVGV